MLRRHSEVPLYVTPLEVVKIKEEVCIKNFSTVKYPTDTMYFSCVGHLGHYHMLSLSYLSAEPHYFLHHKGHLGQPWEGS